MSSPSLLCSFPLMEQVRPPGAPGLEICSTFCSLELEFYMSLVRYNPKEHKCGRFQLSYTGRTARGQRKHGSGKLKVLHQRGFLMPTVYSLHSSSNITKKETHGNLKWNCYNLVYLELSLLAFLSLAPTHFGHLPKGKDRSQSPGFHPSPCSMSPLRGSLVSPRLICQVHCNYLGQKITCKHVVSTQSASQYQLV